MKGWRIATILLAVAVLCLLHFGGYAWVRVNTLTLRNAELSYAYNQQNVAIEQLGKINDENIALWREKVAELEVEIKSLEEEIRN